MSFGIVFKQCVWAIVRKAGACPLHWMINHLPRPGPAHNGADTLSHFIIVAVDGTFAASGLLGADAAVVEAVEGVVEQFAAGWIECTDTYSFISLKSI